MFTPASAPMSRLLAFIPALALGLLILGCAETDTTAAPPEAMPEVEAATQSAPTPPAMVANPDTAVFAGGCFWCMETAFEGRDGIVAVVSGFAGGTLANPSYDDVTRGGTGHYEVVEVIYDADVISYERLLEIFWHNIDPFDAGGQFCDRGDTYRTALFPRNDAQRQLAEASKTAVQSELDRPIVTEILPSAPFYPAEEYHQDFWLKDPNRYFSYRIGCRRDARLEEVWGDEAGEDPVIRTH